MTAPSPDRPLVIDARALADAGVVPWAEVAGVPLVARHVRQAGKSGRTAVTVLASDDAGRAAVLRALAARPAPGVRVAVEVGPPAPGTEVVPALGVHGPGGVLVRAIAGPADLAEAERGLYAALRKSVALDGFVAYHAMRPLARLVTRLLVGTRVTPNQVTLAALALGLLAAGAASAGALAAAGALFLAGATVDCVDGELARLRVEGSRAGEWLDSLADELATFALMVGMGVWLGGPWAVASGIGVLSGLATAAKLYSDLDRLGLPIDTARYPWFYTRVAREQTGTRRGLARVVYATSYLFKRDAYTTIVALCLLVGAPRLAFLLLFGGIEVITVLLLVHLVVIHAHPRSSS